MIVTAHIDLTECDTVRVADEYTGVVVKVLLYSDSDNQPVQVALDALDAIARLRLIAAGHVTSIEILPAVAGSCFETYFDWRVSADGTEVVRADGLPYRLETARG